MLKYVDTLVSFSEIPDEISLCINISNCPHSCIGCHSPYLKQDIGENLTIEKLDELITTNRGISCVCFMGGDSDPWHIAHLAMYVKETYPNLKVSWYSGRDRIHSYITAMYHKFDYIKIGPYIPKLGGLDSETTNQIMYKVEDEELIDITYRFKHDSKSSV